VALNFFVKDEMQKERNEEAENNNVDDGAIIEQHNIDELQAHGINVSDLKKLSEAGIATVAGIMMMTTKNLIEIKGMSDAKVAKIREVSAKLLGFGFQVHQVLVGTFNGWDVLNF
jgi:hypothetical protein